MQLAQSMLAFIGEAAAAQPMAEAVVKSEPALTGLASSGASPWATVGVFVILAAAAFFIIYRRRSGGPQGNALEVVSARALNQRTRLVLISVRGRELLLSVSDKGAELISEWISEEKELADEAPQSAPLMTTSKITPLPIPSNDHAAGDALSGIRALRKKTNFAKPIATWNQSLEDALQKELRR